MGKTGCGRDVLGPGYWTLGFALLLAFLFIVRTAFRASPRLACAKSGVAFFELCVRIDDRFRDHGACTAFDYEGQGYPCRDESQCGESCPAAQRVEHVVEDEAG